MLVSYSACWLFIVDSALLANQIYSEDQLNNIETDYTKNGTNWFDNNTEIMKEKLKTIDLINNQLNCCGWNNNSIIYKNSFPSSCCSQINLNNSTCATNTKTTCFDKLTESISIVKWTLFCLEFLSSIFGIVSLFNFRKTFHYQQANQGAYS